MILRIREHASDDPPGDQHVCRAPRELILFNIARRLCQMPTKHARQLFLADLRVVEAPEFMLDLESMVRRVWPHRLLHIKQCWETLFPAQQETSSVVE